ncbi:transcription factor bHLH147-like [Impatiens glandulifera]|uniref:transcription factor bHLH147-like n=1 Tax=Impatiens glandulifera TaxID=253017 RepID=UPI001FB06416|nr:transcription factor bHLH147-like [Impatiens glandulifera]
MMMSSPIPNPSMMMMTRRKKKKAKIVRDQIQDSNNITNLQWKSEAHQQVYSSKLLQALRQVRLTSYPPPRRGKVMREAADRVLAATAKGRTRWSRAILKNRVTLKFMKNRRQRVAMATLAVRNRPPKKPRLSILRLKSKKLPAVQRKVRILGKLVPGCRKETLPVILEETIDYISALQMQIRVMSGLDKLLSATIPFPN